MAKRKTHSEAWWSTAPPHILRCTGRNRSNGERCHSEAAPGTSVCERHGALIPVVQEAAARRIQMSVDDAAKKLLEMVEDPNVESRDKVKILHDLLDRGGLGATSKHLVGVIGAHDPVETLFLDLLSTPGALEDPARQVLPPDPEQLALDRRAGSENLDFEDLIGGEDIVDAELVEEVPARPMPVEAKTSRNPATPPKHIREALEKLL